MKNTPTPKPNTGHFRGGFFGNALTNCRICGKRTHTNVGGRGGLDLCRACLDAVDLENEHFDGYHDKPVAKCLHCQKMGAKS